MPRPSSRSRVLVITAAFWLLVGALVGGAGFGCSRSSLQDELGLPNGDSCATQPCPAGTTCDPTTLTCVSAGTDGGNPDDGQTVDGCNANTSFDPNNCGACGNVCPTGSSCVTGACTPPSLTCASVGCPIGETCCGVGCVNTAADPNNCGSCGIPCPKGFSCVDATCQPPVGSCTFTGCPPNLSCCGAVCVDVTDDPNNCGGCGLTCATAKGEACLNDQCCIPVPGGMCSTAVCNCNLGETCCGARGCIDTATDNENCGACGHACQNGGSCVSSMCTATCAGGPECGKGQSCCANGCSTVTSDPLNCGACGVVCNPGQACVTGMCVDTCGDGGGSCQAGESCCPSGCANTQADPFNCGGCNIQCGATASCVDGSCVAEEGAFDPTVNPTYLSPGVHNFTTINVPAGVTVYVAGAGPASGTLDLHATGAITIDGTIDVSGGPGTQNTITSQSTQSGRAGGGGFTGEPYATAVLSAACQFVAGNPGSLGLAISGSSGSCTVGSSTVCDTIDSPSSEVFAAPPAQYGGGAGVFTGFRAYGSGGGGPAGGGPGSAGAAYPGEPDCGGVTGGGGATNGGGGSGGGGAYDGTAGLLGQTQCTGVQGAPAAFVGGGGGGSIGAAAAVDLAVATTFQTGSGGGGASADYLNRPVFGGTSGGGGGGGALRLATPATITVTGMLLANGGEGGDSVIGTPQPNCDPQPGAGGGGGSGGVIYLSAPSITVSPSATISAQGGQGGAQSEFATGGQGGTGGLGRIRVSVDPASCTLSGSFNPALQAGCNPVGAAGFAYVGVYPN